MTCKLHGTYKSYKYIELINTYNTYVTSKMILPKHGDSPNGEMRMTPAETVSTSAPRPWHPRGCPGASKRCWWVPVAGASLHDWSGDIWGKLLQMFMDVYGCLWYTIGILFPSISYFFKKSLSMYHCITGWEWFGEAWCLPSNFGQHWYVQYRKTTASRLSFGEDPSQLQPWRIDTVPESFNLDIF